MTTHEKHNVLIGALLCGAAVVVLLLWGQHGGSLTFSQPQDGTLPSLDQTPQTDPTYTNYNIGGYNPPAPVVLGPTTLGSPYSGMGGCGCNDCGPSGGMNISTALFNSLV